MRSARPAVLRDLLKDPGQMALAGWAREVRGLQDDAALLMESREALRADRCLARELASVRRARPELQGPALARAVLRHDQLLFWAERTCVSELDEHLRLLTRLMDGLTPQRLLHLAHDQIETRHLAYVKHAGSALKSLHLLSGEAPDEAFEQAQTDVRRVRKAWRDMHDTVRGLQQLMQDLHHDSLAPFVSDWVGECQTVLDNWHRSAQIMERQLRDRCEAQGGK